MNRPDVSIIIVNYNTFELTSQCLASIYNLSKASFEIVLVDNGSTECNPEKFLLEFPAIKLIKSVENLGFAKGNNLGIASASGDYILLLNSDTILLNDAITPCLAFLKQHKNVAVTTCRLQFPDGATQHNCQSFPSISKSLVELFRIQKIFPSIKRKLFGSFFDYASVAYPDWVWGTFFMFRKELLNQLPSAKLADDFFMYGEDMQWCMEFRKLGFEVSFLPDAKITHLMGASQGAKNAMMEQNLNAFMEKYYSAWKRMGIRIINFLLKARYAYN